MYCPVDDVVLLLKLTPTLSWLNGCHTVRLTLLLLLPLKLK